MVINYTDRAKGSGIPPSWSRDLGTERPKDETDQLQRLQVSYKLSSSKETLPKARIKSSTVSRAIMHALSFTWDMTSGHGIGGKHV